jgi:vitamin B12 transporter
MSPWFRACRRATASGFLCFPALAAAQATQSLQTIVVTATRTPQRVANVLSDVVVIDAETIERAGPISLPELLQAQGGVELAANGGPGQLASVFIRGSNANHVVVLIDGVRVNSATAGTTAIENIPLAQIERIEVLRGPASSLYGADAIGSVIQIFTKQGERTTAAAGAGTWNTRTASFGVGRTLGATAVSLQAGYLESDAFSATNERLPTNFDPDNDPYRNSNVSLAVGHSLLEGHSVALRVFHSDGRTHYDDFGNTDATDRQRLTSAALETRNRITPQWRSLVRIALGSDHRADEAAVPFFFKTDQTQATWQNDVGALGGQVAAGLEWRQEKVASDTPFDRARRHVGSLFASYAATFAEHLLQAALRRDDDQQFGGRTTGNLAYGYRVTPALRLSASAGTAFKAPTFNDLYFPGFGNPNLQPEKSRSAEIAARYDDGALQAGLTLFENRIRDLIQFDFATSAPLNVARARNRGATLGVGYTAGAWRTRLEWTHQNPVDEDTGARLPRRARNLGSAGLAMAPGPWRAGIDVVASGERFDNAFAPPPPRLAGYVVVNLHAAYALTDAFSVSARLNNAADRSYELVQGYNTPRRNVFVGVRYAAK